ncbi:DUF4148 domain-containing protein [Roseateles sp. GG27B]
MSQKTFLSIALIAISFAGTAHAAGSTDNTVLAAETGTAIQASSAKTRAEVIAELQRARASGEMQQWDTNSYARPTLNRLNDAQTQNAKPSRM